MKIKDLIQELRDDYNTFYDQSGAIGKRYRRMDEIQTALNNICDYMGKSEYKDNAQLRQYIKWAIRNSGNDKTFLQGEIEKLESQNKQLLETVEKTKGMYFDNLQAKDNEISQLLKTVEGLKCCGNCKYDCEELKLSKCIRSKRARSNSTDCWIKR